jgi:hypothetical protein
LRGGCPETIREHHRYALLAIREPLPWYFNLRFLAAAGNLLGFLRAGFANPAVASVTVDIMIASVAFLIWMVMEARRLRMGHWWVYVVLTFSVAFACAFPLFLMMRQRRLRQMEAANSQ